MQTATRPADEMEEGDTHASVAVGEPGVFILVPASDRRTRPCRSPDYPERTGLAVRGGHVGIVRRPSPDAVYEGGGSVDTPRTWTAPVIGGTLGYGPFDSGESTRTQIELKANLPIWGDEGEPPMSASGVSVGVSGLLD